MAAISAGMVKDLREKTGAGMMDCKKALAETNGDKEKAVEWLRQKGIASAEKKSGRTAAEGAIGSGVFPMPATGCDILLNADGARGLRVELLDQEFRPLPGFSGADSALVDSDGGLDCLLKWPRDTLQSLGGRKVRLMVHLKKAGDNQPRVFAITLRPR